MNNRTVIYCRVSDPKQVKEGNSLVSQERICREYALANGLTVIEIFIEKGESAKDTNRTEFRKLLKYCIDKKNQVGIVLAYKLDRIARRKFDYESIKISLKKHAIEIRSATENFDTTPSGKFMESVLADVAQFDNDMRTERCIGGMRQAMLEGRYVWIAPLGYDNVRINDKSTIAQNEIAPFVLQTFEAIAQNRASIEETRKEMLKKGLTNTSGNPLSRAQFYRILKNQVYAGWIVKFGERHKGIYDPIVSEDLFEQVQRVLKHRQRRNISYLLQNPDFPLRRFVHHGNGERLTGSWSKGRKQYYAYYRFKMQGYEFKKEGIETLFMEFIDRYQFNKQKIKELTIYLKKHLVHDTKEQHKSMLRLQQEINVIKDRQKLLVQKNLEGVISNNLLREHLEQIEMDLLKKNAVLASLPRKETNIEELIKFSFEYLEKPSAIWARANLEGKLKLQWFHFPKGITFDGTKFGTIEIPSIFKAKSFFLTNLSHSADTKNISSNQQVGSKPTQKASLLPPKETIETMNEEIVKLGKIIQEVHTGPPEIPAPASSVTHPSYQGRFPAPNVIEEEIFLDSG